MRDRAKSLTKYLALIFIVYLVLRHSSKEPKNNNSPEGIQEYRHRLLDAACAKYGGRVNGENVMRHIFWHDETATAYCSMEKVHYRR